MEKRILVSSKPTQGRLRLQRNMMNTLDRFGFGEPSRRTTPANTAGPRLWLSGTRVLPGHRVCPHGSQVTMLLADGTWIGKPDTRGAWHAL